VSARVHGPGGGVEEIQNRGGDRRVQGPEQVAHIVPKYLKEQGYRIIPINPTASEILGEKAYKSLMEVPDEVEVVEVFRPGERCPR
jgi:predicted CoA-binding protein